MYEDGFFKHGKLYSRHPNLLRSVIIGKKGWGLWVDEWTNGIVDWTFTREEIMSNFEEFNIKVPESFIKDFDNVLEKKKKKRNEKYYEFLQKNK